MEKPDKQSRHVSGEPGMHSAQLTTLHGAAAVRGGREVLLGKSIGAHPPATYGVGKLVTAEHMCGK
jgi:hypothetical protein